MLPLWIAFLIAIALVAVGVWLYRRNFHKASGREDRYTPERILSPEQVAMLDYLRDTFPDQVVLPNISLSEMLSVRRSSDVRRANDRLKTQKVDFVVCDNEGRAVFAFDVEQYHLSDAKAKNHRVKIKNRILKTAGVRFLFLKNSIARMPSPDDFRRQLDLAALPRPKPQDPQEAQESVRQQLESQMSDYDNLIYPTTGFRESEVMGLSGLMDLGDAKASRKSEHDRQIEAVRRRA
ncbi:MAG: DUF2726 domain-containing protein [Hydrogenophaga sp.]|nr:DUF2726 domain-containing protein [Hydrogenophaga sp.]